MQLFSADPIIFSKKNVYQFFVHENLKKRSSKITHNRPKPFFSQYSPAHSPELIFHIKNMSQDSFVSLFVQYIFFDRMLNSMNLEEFYIHLKKCAGRWNHLVGKICPPQVGIVLHICQKWGGAWHPWHPWHSLFRHPCDVTVEFSQKWVSTVYQENRHE